MSPRPYPGAGVRLFDSGCLDEGSDGHPFRFVDAVWTHLLDRGMARIARRSERGMRRSALAGAAWALVAGLAPRDAAVAACLRIRAMLAARLRVLLDGCRSSLNRVGHGREAHSGHRKDGEHSGEQETLRHGFSRESRKARTPREERKCEHVGCRNRTEASLQGRRLHLTTDIAETCARGVRLDHGGTAVHFRI